MDVTVTIEAAVERRGRTFILFINGKEQGRFDILDIAAISEKDVAQAVAFLDELELKERAGTPLHG